MELTVDNALKEMLRAGAAAFGEAWGQVSRFAKAEFAKIAQTLVAIAENVAAFQRNPDEGYPPEVGRKLLEMQKASTEAVFVSLTALTLIAVERAINAVLEVVRQLFSAALGAVL